MPAWLVAIWDSIRGGIWFVPSIALILAVTSALVIPEIDGLVNVTRVGGLGWMETTAEGARTTLASITGALIAMASVVFSVSMVTLSLTTSQFGSRLLRTFLNSNATQITLGVFLGACAYCLLVLQSITAQQDHTFVPHLSISVAVFSTVAALGVFVYFMHHVATSIQAQSVVRAVAADLDQAIDVLFPERIGDSMRSGDSNVDAQEDLSNLEWSGVSAEEEGYLQAIDGEFLLKAAREQNIVLRLLYQPGQFVVRQTPLVEISPAGSCDEEFANDVRSAFVVGSRRTPRQDVACAIDELVEVAVRALSPGINDPFTATTCIDYLGAAMRRMVSRTTPRPQRFDEQGELRIVAQPVTFGDALDAALNQIRVYGSDSALVHQRLLQALEIIAEAVTSDDAASSVTRHADMVLRSARRNLPEENDVGQAEILHSSVLGILNGKH